MFRDSARGAMSNMTTETVDLSTYFEEAELNRDVIAQYANAAHASFRARERFDAILEEQEADGDPLKLAVGYLILGQFTEALTQFDKAAASALRDYYAAEAALGLNRFEDAIRFFESAGRQGWDPLDTAMRVAEVHVRAGNPDEADKLVQQHESAGHERVEWHYLRGVLAEARDDRETAMDAYEKALEFDEDHVPTLFRCARLYDLCGEDDEALRLYDQLSGEPRAHVNALMNAAVMYEDRGRYDESAECLRRVLKAFPSHKRARLFFKSVESCREMEFEEIGEQPVDARTRLLNTPLSEFELSVRARNCLKKMNIRTIGELMKLSEAELLAYKNFGETSLAEIKQLLSAKGLRLGQSPEEIEVAEAEPPAPAPKSTVPPGQEATLSKSVSELELSVRSRRCLQRLNVQSLGDLVQYSESDLLATRNFGVTSLNEIKSRLADFGLQLSTK